LAWPVAAQAQSFPASFRTQDIQTEDATLHVRVGGQGPPVVQGGERRSLRSLGTAAALRYRDPRGVPIALLIVAGSPEAGLFVMTPVLNPQGKRI